MTTQKVIMYMPSIQKDGQVIENRDNKLNDSLLLFADLFGGATSYNASGSWKLSDGKLQVEPITIIYSHVENLTNDTKTKFISYAKKLKADCKQDSVLIEIDNKPIFI